MNMWFFTRHTFAKAKLQYVSRLAASGCELLSDGREAYIFPSFPTQSRLAMMYRSFIQKDSSLKLLPTSSPKLHVNASHLHIHSLLVFVLSIMFVVTYVQDTRRGTRGSRRRACGRPDLDARTSAGGAPCGRRRCRQSGATAKATRTQVAEASVMGEGGDH